jgi:hypothetical protein
MDGIQGRFAKLDCDDGIDGRTPIKGQKNDTNMRNLTRSKRG